MMKALAAHADWSVDPRKRWMCIAGADGLRVEPVGDLATLLDRLRAEAAGRPVALGVDFPIGLPRAYAALHAGAASFPAFLRQLPPGFLDVCAELHEIGPARPFYPMRGRRGMTRLSHALALGLADTNGLSRACDRATPDRPAGAPLFWTLGANQTGKAAISAWRDLLIPALASADPPALWPFDGPLRAALTGTRVVIAETYPADAMRQLGLRMGGSKRRHADRLALAPALRAAMRQLDVQPTPQLDTLLDQGCGTDPAGEDRLDCLLGALCVMAVLLGRRPDDAPPETLPWEGWVLGQTHPATHPAHPAAYTPPPCHPPPPPASAGSRPRRSTAD